MNGLLAMSELAVVSSRRSRLEQLANQVAVVRAPPFASLTIRAGSLDGSDRHHFVGIVAGHSAVRPWGSGSAAGSIPSRRSPRTVVPRIAVTVVGITYLSLILGELVPKRIALASLSELPRLSPGR
jgi:putative hemolysin